MHSVYRQSLRLKPQTSNIKHKHRESDKSVDRLGRKKTPPAEARDIVRQHRQRIHSSSAGNAGRSRNRSWLTGENQWELEDSDPGDTDGLTDSQSGDSTNYSNLRVGDLDAVPDRIMDQSCALVSHIWFSYVCVYNSGGPCV